MFRRFALVGLAGATLGGCAVGGPTPERVSAVSAERPLDSLPAGFDPALARQDLLSTAADQFGREMLSEALASPTYLIAKRFAGMAPPPPPGAGSDWSPPTRSALLIRRAGTWLAATGSQWRPIDGAAALELDAIVAAPRFWNEAAYTLACPDFGASLLLLKARGRPATVRNSQCQSSASSAVEAALRDS